MKFDLTSAQVKTMIVDKLSHNFGVSPENATDEQFLQGLCVDPAGFDGVPL